MAQIEYLDKMTELTQTLLDRQKPLCTSFVHFVGHIMSKKDSNEEVQSFANCLQSLLNEIMLQADVYDLQANQLRLTQVQKPVSAVISSATPTGGRLQSATSNKRR